MCDPVSMLVGAVGGAALSKRGSSAPAAALPDPAKEQADAEARAAQAANAKLAQDQQRRRQQQSLIARGAPTVQGPTLGDTTASDSASPLSGNRMNRGTVARRTQSLMARGATASGGPAAMAGGRGSGAITNFVNDA
jgi:hypothetical protein